MPRLPAGTVDGWLSELGLRPLERAERDGISSWDLELDGRRRSGVRMTLILDPARALLLWVHFAPPLSDSFRVSYRQFLRWNDELPFVKFALTDEDRPVLTAELPVRSLDRDELGRAVCRLLAVCDLTLERAVVWLYPGARTAPPMPGPSRQAAAARALCRGPRRAAWPSAARTAASGHERSRERPDGTDPTCYTRRPDGKREPGAPPPFP